MLITWSNVPMLDRVRDDVMGSAFGHAAKPTGFTPAADVIAEENELLFHVDVPGIPLEDLEVTLERGVLSIKGARKRTVRDASRASLGRGYGPFALSYKLPSTVDGDSLSATLADGVLTVRVAKQPKPQPRKIDIRVGAATQISGPVVEATGSLDHAT